MLKLTVKNRLRAATLLLLFVSISSFYVFHNVSMWQNALTSSRDASTAMGAFVEASEWLSERLGQDEIAVVPSPEVFYVLNPELRGKLVDYQSLWDYAGVAFRERANQDKLLQLRGYFINFLNGNFSVRYLVRDWGEPYTKYLFEAPINDEFMLLLREVKVIPFTLSTGWSSKITIYERVQYATLLRMRLSSPQKLSFTIPSDVSIQYNWSGATIQKVGPRVGFYLPLEAEINASKQNYLTMQIKPDMEDLNLLIVFYYDTDRDGKFSGFDIDYVKSATFNQTELGWVKGKRYMIYQVIPKADDPVVQIGIVMMGDEDGAITLSDLIVYTEITSDVVLSEASNWLLENLGEDEFALVPSPGAFYIENPELRHKLVYYSSLWTSVYLQANTTEVLKVRSYLVDSLKGNSSINYIVRDWVDPYAERLYEAPASDELMFLLREVKELFFTLAGGWVRKITIYERVRYTTLFAMNFSSPPNKYFTLPANTSVQFDSNGATIQKAGSRVGFYLPLEAGIDVSKQIYFMMQIKLDVENLNLTIVFYYDKDRDGIFSGFEIDYVKSWLFSQTQQDWIKGEWYKIFQVIPEANDPMVQIGIILRGDEDGAITISEFVAHIETTFQS